DQKRIGKVFAEIGERGKRLGMVRRFQVSVAQVAGNVVSEFAGARLGPVERVNGFAIVVIERVRIADYEPGQRSGICILSGVTARIGFDSGIGGGSAVLEQLLRHGTKTGGGDKGSPHPAHAGRGCLTLLPGAGGTGSGGFLLDGCSLRRRGLRRRALGWRGLSWRRR